MDQSKIGDPMNILFTGARSGIAKDVIDKIKHKNVTIYVSVYTKSQLAEIKKIYQSNFNIHPLKIDITSKKDQEKLENLKIDILVCNAGVGYGGSISEMPMEKLRENFEVNVFSNFEIVQTVLKQMIERKEGRIIMMSSLAGIVPVPFLGGYCATKASIIKLAETLRMELKLLKTDIKMILVEPGLYLTGFNRVMLENKYEDFETSYFKNQEKVLRKKEDLFLHLLGKKNLDSISNCILKAIQKKHPKRVYRAPFSQKVGAFLYKVIS